MNRGGMLGRLRRLEQAAPFSTAGDRADALVRRVLLDQRPVQDWTDEESRWAGDFDRVAVL